MSDVVRHCAMERRADAESHRGVGGQISLCMSQVMVSPAWNSDGKRHG